jgi:hypothetical protein
MDLNDITFKTNGAVFFTHPRAEIKRFVLNLPEGHDA